MRHSIIAICVVLSLVAIWLIVREVGKQATAVAEAVLPAGPRRSIEQTFREYLASVQAAKGDELLVADVRAVNEIERSDTRREFWTGISLGTTTASVRYPVTYRYCIRISDTWRLRLDGRMLLIRRPVLRPLEPAIDTAHIDFRSENGWMRWNRDEVRDELLRQLTPDAITRAREHIATATPHADQAVIAFVRAWLLSAADLPRDATIVMQDEVEGSDIRVR